MAATPDARPAPPLAAADGVMVLLAAFAVGVPFVRFTGFASLYDSQRLAEVLILALALTAAVRTGGVVAFRRGARALPGSARAALAAVAGLGLVSAARAAEPLYAFAEVGMWAVLVALALLLAGHWATGTTDPKTLLGALVVAGAAVTAGLIVARHTGSLLAGEAGWPEAAAAFGNRRTLNQLQLVMLPVLFAIAAAPVATASGATARRWGAHGLRWAIRVVAGVQVALLVASGGRAVLLGLALGLVAWGAVHRGRCGPVLREWVGGALAGMAVYGALFLAWGAGGSYGRRVFAAYRDVLWEAALRMAADHPLLGVGPMHFAYFQTPKGDHPHNIVLQLAAEWGLPAAALATGVVVWGLAAWLSAVRRAADAPERRAWRGALTVALVASLVSGLFDSFAMVPAPQIWGVLVLAALLAEYRRMVPAAAPAAETTASRPWRVAVAAGALLAFGPVAGVTVRDAPTVAQRAYERRAWLSPVPPRPRYWQVGAIAPAEGPPAAESARYWPTPLPPRTVLLRDISAR